VTHFANFHDALSAALANPNSGVVAITEQEPFNEERIGEIEPARELPFHSPGDAE
jgi:hypothetical protein